MEKGINLNLQIKSFHINKIIGDFTLMEETTLFHKSYLISFSSFIRKNIESSQWILCSIRDWKMNPDSLFFMLEFSISVYHYLWRECY